MIENGDVLYHGTSVDFDKIDLKFCKPDKDFGFGFYATKWFDQAAKWAVKRASSKDIGYVHEYIVKELDISKLKCLQLLVYDKSWADYVCKCRFENYDSQGKIKHQLVYDRMADSKYTDLIKALDEYYNGIITIEKLLEVAKFNDIRNDQYCFKDNKALKCLVKTRTAVVKRKDKKFEIEKWLIK
ncbi:MAG: hypothetical protein K0S41_599 [Anaerocolumna sp.]|nr:hypothetical protein [Anaerocolumna sp.]